MFKLIILFVLLAVSFYVVKLVLENRKRERALKKSVFKKNRDNKQNNMVRCISCGLYVPEDEAIKQGDNIFCSQKHANQPRE